MSETTAIISSMIPKAKLFGSTIASFVTWLIILVLVLALIGVGVYFWVRNRKYSKQIVLFELLNGRFQPTRKDRAMEMRFGNSGDTVFHCLKCKKYLPTPTMQTGINTYWFFVRSDGEWINFEPDDFNETARKMGAKFLDKEMRYARTQIQKGLKNEFEELSFMQKYGTMVLSIVYLVVLGMMIWLLFDKWIALAGQTTEAMKVAERVLEATEKILGSVDNIQSGGSGMVQAA